MECEEGRGGGSEEERVGVRGGVRRVEGEGVRRRGLE